MEIFFVLSVFLMMTGFTAFSLQTTDVESSRVTLSLPKGRGLLMDSIKTTKGCWGPFETIVGALKSKYKGKEIDYIEQKIDEFRINLDEESDNALVYAGQCMESFIRSRTCPTITPYQSYHVNQYYKERSSYPSKYKISHHLQEVFYFHHGLRFAPKCVQDYVRTRDFMDIGAYIGDSAIILSQYTDKKVYSYEFSPGLEARINKSVKDNNIEDKVVFVPKGMSSQSGTMYIRDVHNAGGSINMKGGTPVQITTVDDEVRTRGMKVGYIKADVEGVGLEVLKGAMKTLREDRPVLEIACYHSFAEFFELPEFMRQFPNYIWKFNSENTNTMSMGEIAFFAYPAEIRYPTN